MTVPLMLMGCHIFMDTDSQPVGNDVALDAPVDAGTEVDARVDLNQQPDLQPDMRPDVDIDPILAFVVESEEQFLEGEGFNNVAWGDSGLEIDSLVGQNGITSGVYESKIFDGGETPEWQTLTWEPERPYFFPYPVGGRSETTYPRGNFDSDSLIFMSRMEKNAGVIDMNDPFVDDSENQRAISVVGNVTVEASPLGTGVRMDGTGHLESDGGALAPYSPEMNDFTITALVFTNDCPSTVQTVFALDELSTNGKAIFLGCLPPGLGCTDPEMTGRFAAVVAPEVNSLFYACDPQPPANAWEHLALVKRGTTLSIFVNGERRSQAQVGNGSYDLAATTLIKLGRLDFTNSISNNLLIDEVTYFHRALDDFEVQDQILRFWLLANIQVRTCDDALCTDVPDWDTDPDVQVYADSYNGPSVSLSELPQRRYIQFRTQFVTLSLVETPRIGRIAIAGLR